MLESIKLEGRLKSIIEIGPTLMISSDKDKKKGHNPQGFYSLLEVEVDNIKKRIIVNTLIFPDSIGHNIRIFNTKIYEGYSCVEDLDNGRKYKYFKY